jgi:hypothetical protein
MHWVQIAVSQWTANSSFAQAVKWVIQTFSGIFLLFSFLLTYRHNVKVRSSDLLLKLEEHFNSLGSKLAFLEYERTCYEPIKGILVAFGQDSDLLSESERKTLGDIDECLRFLYICSLHAGEKVHLLDGRRLWDVLHPSRLPHAYYYYLNKLNDNEHRPELYEYVRRFFPAFSAWLHRNEDALAYPETLMKATKKQPNNERR